MDWIQIWAAVIIILNCMSVGYNLAMHDKPKKDDHSFFVSFFALLLLLPHYGRVFGWW